MQILTWGPFGHTLTTLAFNSMVCQTSLTVVCVRGCRLPDEGVGRRSEASGSGVGQVLLQLFGSQQTAARRYDPAR